MPRWPFVSVLLPPRLWTKPKHTVISRRAIEHCEAWGRKTFAGRKINVDMVLDESGVHLSEWERGKKGAIPHATVRLWVDGVEQKRREHIKIPPVPKKQVPKTSKKRAPKTSKKQRNL